MTATAESYADVVRDDATLRRFLHGLPGVDQVGAQARAAALATRSIKKQSKRWALDLAIRCVDLTTLEGADTPGKVRALCAKGRRPDPTDPETPPVAAICIYPDLVPVAKAELAGSTVKVASVATAFPSGRAGLPVKLADTREAVAAGADEIVAVREACGAAHLKVILETGELSTLDNVRRASWLALLAGGHVIKTSTGKVSPAAAPTTSLVMLEAVRDFHLSTGDRRGVKLAGGIRTAKEAIRYLVQVNEVAGPEWLDPDLFRFGASTLLNDLILQRQKERTGAYSGPDYVTLD